MGIGNSTSPTINSTSYLISQGAGAVGSAVGAYGASSAKKIGLNSQANIADINAQLSEKEAQQTILAGQQQEQSADLKTAQLKSTQRTNMAANGIELGSPTAVNVLNTTDALGKIDANTIAANATRSAWGYRLQGVNYQNQAALSRSAAKGISPLEDAGTSLLTSARQIETSRYLLNKVGAFDDPKQAYGPQQANWFTRQYYNLSNSF